MPAALLKVEPARQRQLRLAEGLGSPDAENVLRALDDDGRLGLRDAPGELLDGLRQHTRGFPRALEAVKAILDGDDTLTPRDLLDRTGQLPEDQVVQVLIGEAYDLLDAPAPAGDAGPGRLPRAGVSGRGRLRRAESLKSRRMRRLPAPRYPRPWAYRLRARPTLRRF
jgi:hypothetical protein